MLWPLPIRQLTELLAEHGDAELGNVPIAIAGVLAARRPPKTRPKKKDEADRQGGAPPTAKATICGEGVCGGKACYTDFQQFGL